MLLTYKHTCMRTYNQCKIKNDDTSFFFFYHVLNKHVRDDFLPLFFFVSPSPAYFSVAQNADPLKGKYTPNNNNGLAFTNILTLANAFLWSNSGCILCHIAQPPRWLVQVQSTTLWYCLWKSSALYIQCLQLKIQWSLLSLMNKTLGRYTNKSKILIATKNPFLTQCAVVSNVIIILNHCIG